VAFPSRRGLGFYVKSRRHLRGFEKVKENTKLRGLGKAGKEAFIDGPVASNV
jgi:hypothetical protein